MDTSTQAPARPPNARRTLPSTKFVGFILWWLVMTASLMAITFIGQAYRYSSHEPGAWKDADLWFLLQSSFMQVLNLMTALISTYGDANIHTPT